MHHSSIRREAIMSRMSRWGATVSALNCWNSCEPRRYRVHRKTRNSRRSRPCSSGSNPVPPQTKGILTTPVELVLHQDITKSMWLDYGAYVGHRTRTMEFKAGSGNYMWNRFEADVERYGCAFLNSEGGSLVVGVNDDGFVRGVPFSNKSEDDIRHQVYRVLHAFTPTLFSCSYSLRFLPVVKLGGSDRNLRVLCLTFKAPSGSSEPVLYTSVQGRVLIKGEASVRGPLGLPAIIEWYRQKFPYLMTHFVCQDLSREKHFVDHRRMMNKIISIAKYQNEVCSQRFPDSCENSTYQSS
ncbi:schlafen-like protein 1 [Notolabrus celidotus]|uniref:schlafen-like protein 1 n=1 Tax=Notolabrus celidotus TaxID=1203425 RepID=UPI001490615E|nr:schlafen-like protein 1 [Notolabrus celidotus]